MSIPAAKQPPSRIRIVAALVCAASAFVLFQWFGNATRGYVNTPSLFWWWVSQWIDPNAETGHGWIILGLSGWLGWRNLRRADPPGLEAGDGESAPRDRRSEIVAPITAMLAGLALHALGFVAQQSRISIVGLLVFTWGVLRLAGGRRWGAAAVFPLGFMLFAIPVSMLDEVGLPLRLWVTSAGEKIAHAAGVGVLRSGTQLVAPDGRFNYDVAAPCSGVRSLVALTALSLLLGYLNFRSWSRRALVLALCFPLVYLGNVARIVAIVFAAHWGGVIWGERAHEVMGYGVFVIVLGGVLAAVRAIHRWLPEREKMEPAPRAGLGAGEDATQHGGRQTVAATARRSFSIYPDGRAVRTYLGAAVAVVAITGGEMVFLWSIANAPQRGQVGVALAADGKNPAELPAHIGTDWMAQRAEISAIEREVLPADTGYSRKNYAFVADRKRDVFLSIVLSGRDRTSIHRPELCLVGQGWTIEGTAEHAFRFPDGPEVAATEFKVTLLRVRRERPGPRGPVIEPELVAYWFVGGDVIVASHWGRFLNDAWNRVVHRRVDRWAYVLLQTRASDGEAAALARMQNVLTATLPVFQRPSVGK